MVPSSWNNFLRPLLRFAVVVRISLSSKLMSISFRSDRLESVSLLHRWQKEEEENCKKEEEDCARSNLQRCWSPFFERLFSDSLLSVYLCGFLFDFLHRFGIEFWNCLVREYFESIACILMTYSALI
ncbi:hypothetical protein PVAP13_9NG817900 [Panicum virgatum]|uniref:Uncharacterized protein n=1 Tax=Panicum virgatum TaxID=38727 RepID=A0A8T0N1T9_PANVG|nr:hypothetical protein PVAP13_9NG817900 [Panicum virgatum]